MSYEINILNDEEFEKLPYSGAKNAMGLADPHTNIAYVRQTGVKDIDRHTLEHEFDELLQKVSPHEVDGIRYKSGFDIFKTVLTAASVLFPPLAPIATTVNLASTAHGISQRGFQPLDLLSLAGPATGALKGFSSAAGTAGQAATFGQKFQGALGGALGFGNAASAASPVGKTPSGISRVTVPGVGSNVPINAARASSGLANFAKASAKSLAVNKATEALSSKLGQGVTQGGGPSFESLSGGGGQAGALARFANPLSNIAGSSGQNALNNSDVAEGFANIDANSATRQKSIFELFRGQSPDENSRFSSQLASINVGNEQEKTTFLNEANSANQRKEFIKLNKLDDAQFDEFLNLARSGSDADISSKINQDPNEFRSIFKPFFA